MTSLSAALGPFEQIQGNTSFSQKLPTLQIAWDSTSMGTFKECPYKYYLTMILGYQSRSESVHLTFGLLYHKALEHYDHGRARGMDHESATVFAVKYCMEATWDERRNQPWRSDDPNKNRFTLVRTVVWYLEQFAEDSFETLILDNGKPAVELSFRFENGYESKLTNEHFMTCGHLDRLGKFEADQKNYILDRKTTKNQVDTRFFAKFTPDNQFSTYMVGGKIALGAPVAGLIVDAAQIAVTFSRFERGIIPRSDESLEEWFADYGMYLGQAQIFASSGRWPQNDKSCNNYGGCQFRGVCSKGMSTRAEWLKGEFTRRVWDPLMVRGDI
jgi:hypothetical protein